MPPEQNQSVFWSNRSSSIAILTIGLTAFLLGRELFIEQTSPWAEQLPPYSLDLNTATEAELNLLPGVGPKLAHDIILFRDREGGFSRVDQLLKIQGIKKERLALLERFVFVTKR